jgi:hypothetical protein
MKITTTIAIAVGLAALTACKQSPQENTADNIEANAENTADTIEANADNMSANIQANAENTADAVRDAGENKADAVRNSAANSSCSADFSARARVDGWAPGRQAPSSPIES